MYAIQVVLEPLWPMWPDDIGVIHVAEPAGGLRATCCMSISSKSYMKKLDTSVIYLEIFPSKLKCVEMKMC
jgi:hypothetical protein